MQIGHAHELGAGGTTQGRAEGEAGACPRAGGGEATQGDVQSEAGGLPLGWAGVQLRVRPATRPPVWLPRAT